MLVNLTPHAIHIHVSTPRKRVITVPPSGIVARVVEKTKRAGKFDGVPLVSVTPTAIENLPDPSPGVIFVVSVMIREAAIERRDLASPYDPIRDAEGRVVGCRGLVVNR